MSKEYPKVIVMGKDTEFEGSVKTACLECGKEIHIRSQLIHYLGQAACSECVGKLSISGINTVFVG